MSKLHPRLAMLLLIFAFAAGSAAAAPAQLQLLHTILNPGTQLQGDGQQGFSVAVDGNIAVTGARVESVAAIQEGVARVYDATTGTLLHLLTNPEPKNYAEFGRAVAMSGTRVVVGAYGHSDGGYGVGRVWVYDLARTNPAVPWLTLTNPAPAAGDNFGAAVSISGMRVVVGAYQDDAGAQDAGTAYVYDLGRAAPNVPWLVLTNPSPAASDRFALSVSVSGGMVLVGADQDDAGASNSGSAWLYDLARATPGLPILTLTNPIPGVERRFGTAVSLSGTRALISAPQANAGGNDHGFVFVYQFANPAPATPVLVLTNPSPGTSDRFGTSVAVAGNHAVVGAFRDNVPAILSGKAYLYDLANPAPDTTRVALTNPTPASGDYFGWSVAASSNRVLAGAPYDIPGIERTGAAYLYAWNGVMPTEPMATLDHGLPAAEEWFGSAVAVSGSWIFIGAPMASPGLIRRGAVYVYDLSNSATGLVASTLTNPAGMSGDAFGWAIAASGSRVLVGAPLADGATNDSGKAFVYDLAGPNTNAPYLVLDNPAPRRNDSFGSAVAVSGTRAVVGVPYQSTGAPAAGAAYVYDFTRPVPGTPMASLFNPSPYTNDHFGFAVAISGPRVVIGAPDDDAGAGDVGVAYLYDLASATPSVPALILTNPSPEAGDVFGRAVAADGARVLVSAPLDNAGATDAGVVHVYDLSVAVPTVPFLTLTNPSPQVADSFGQAVALSGTRVAVSAALKDAGATDSGVVYQFDLAGATPAIPVATFTNPSPAAGDQFGLSVALDGAVMAAGVPYDDANAKDRGAAHVFGIAFPGLRITSAPGTATLSWTPTNSPGFVLQYAERLAPSNWVNAPSGAANPVTVPTTGAVRFYRLAQP